MFMDKTVVLIADWKGVAAKAIVHYLARYDITLIINGSEDDVMLHSPTDAEARIIALPFDCSKEADIEATFAGLIDIVGHVDVVVNNFFHWQDSPFDNIERSGWDQVIEKNLYKTFFLSRVSSKLMRALDFGKIINVTTTSAFTGHHTQFAASCAAIHSLTKSMAQELAPSVRVNAIAVGTLDEPWIDEGGPELREGLISTIPLKRLCQAQEVAELVGHLIFGLDYMTGQLLVLDGGETMR